MNHAHLNPHHEHSDSSGVPWEGRDLTDHPFTGDDGSAPPALAAALAAHAAEPDLPAVVAALAGSRLLIPVVSVLEEETATKSAEMAMVSLALTDGRTAMPVFSSVTAMSAWNPQARPVPSEPRRAAVAAVDEKCDVILLDPAGPVPVLVPRPAVWAVAQDLAWVPSHADPQVAQAIAQALAGVPGLVECSCEPGTAAELKVVLQLVPGLTREQVGALTDEVSRRIATLDLVAERVDSLQLALR